MKNNSRQNTRFRWRYAKALESGLEVDANGDTQIKGTLFAPVVNEKTRQDLFDSLSIYYDEGKVDSYEVTIVSDGKYFLTVSGSADVKSQVEGYLKLGSIPLELFSALPSFSIYGIATNNLGEAGFVEGIKGNPSSLSIKFNSNPQARTVYFNITFSVENYEI